MKLRQARKILNFWLKTSSVIYGRGKTQKAIRRNRKRMKLVLRKLKSNQQAAKGGGE